MELKTGDKAVDFCLPDENENEVCLNNFLGKWVVLYFYPKDNTSGCTLEAIDFSEAIDEFKKMGAVIVGISPDSPKSHCSFREKHDLKIMLLSDTEHKTLKEYNAWVLKKMYGREHYGVERSTFLITSTGEIGYVWRKVKVRGHVQEVKEKLKELQAR